MKFDATWESLQQYKCPDWFRDAKFGIWAHWGPQGVPMVGDWYARNLYIEGHPHYRHHCRVYGHPSKFGYKDVVKLWKAEKFDAEALMDLYRQAGARYFVSLGAHHDNFDLWNSKHHKWNSVNVGPGKDIVGMFAKAARAAGLRFGVTEHLERSWSWFNTNKGADKVGPFAGVPYDGNDPSYEQFYFPPHAENTATYPQNAPESWQRHWQTRILDLIEQYNPDLLYTDGAVPFGRVGLEMIAAFYNRNIERCGALDAVYALKDHKHLEYYGYHGEYREGIGVLDVERGVVEGIHPNPWQTDTCIGQWYYRADAEYKQPGEIIQMLVDIVSKNGNLLLNFPVRPDGTLDAEEHWIAREIGQWLAVNGEAIYGTRPWMLSGEGPTRLEAGAFAEDKKKTFGPADFRFTRCGDTLYAIALGWPSNRELEIKSLGSLNTPVVITGVELLGAGPVPSFGRYGSTLKVTLPAQRPCDHAYTLKISCQM